MRASRLVSLLLLLQARGGMTAAELARGARGLGPDGAPRRRGAGCLRRADLRRSRAARRHPTRRRLPHPAHRHDHGGGGRPVPVRAPGPGRGARARAPWSRPHGSRCWPRCRPSCAVARAGSSSASTSTPPAGSAPASPCPISRRSPSACGTGQRMELDYERAGLASSPAPWTRWASCSRPGSGTSSPRHAGQVRTYRISRARGAAPLAEKADRPTGFDLATHWSESIAAYERDQPRIEVTLRVRREATRWLEDVHRRRGPRRGRRGARSRARRVAAHPHHARLAPRGGRSPARPGRRRSR